jgi:hypothetical protein
MEIEFFCPGCRTACQVEASDTSAVIRCSACGRSFSQPAEFSSAQTGVQRCGICGCRDLYIQKDFNRKIGVAIVVVGAVLAPFTKLISLLVCALIDLMLYRVLPTITICYRCHTIYRDVAMNPEHDGFNLGINDRYRAAERERPAGEPGSSG